METIRKVVNLEKLKSRSFGLAPYIPVNENWSENSNFLSASGINGNWGGIICDCDDFSDYGDNTAEILQKYYKVSKVLDGGIRLKRLVKNGLIYYTANFTDEVRRKAFIPCDDSLFKSLGKGLFRESAETINFQYIRLVSTENYNTFSSLGGFGLINKVEAGLFGLITVPSNIVGARVPDQFYLSQIEPWLEWFRNNEPKVKNEPIDCCVLQEWQDRGGDAMYRFLRQNSNLHESELDRWERRFNDGKLHVPVIKIPVLLTQTYNDNGVLSVDDSESENFKGDLGKKEETFDNIVAESRLGELRSRAKVYDDNSNLLPFIWADSAKTATTIPYVVGELFNVLESQENNILLADYIEDITEDGNTLTFTYVFGGKVRVVGNDYELLGDGGIRYVEKYYFSEQEVTLWGETITYKEIDFNNKTVTIYNRDLELSRSGYLANITGMEVGGVWQLGLTTDNPVYKKEYLNHISEEPKINVDIEVNRGGASAFEKHLRLAECNTLEDLVSYGNNLFNLDS